MSTEDWSEAGGRGSAYWRPEPGEQPEGVGSDLPRSLASQCREVALAGSVAAPANVAMTATA
jgi:hypothetical protein